MRKESTGLMTTTLLVTIALAVGCNDGATTGAALAAPRAEEPTVPDPILEEPGEGPGEPMRAVCRPERGPFRTTIDNPYYPLPVGTRWFYDGMEEGEHVELRVTVLDKTELVAGVTTRVVEEHEQVDGKLAEISRNFLVQTEDGTVCYFGEDVDIYEDGVIVSHEGAWRAGGSNEPGVIMPGAPTIGMSFEQEFAPGIAEDRSRITGAGAKVTVPAGTFTDTLTIVDTNPLDGTSSDKNYARGVGLVFDNGAELIRVESP